ncbi:Cytochrome c, mono-and diheme variants [Rubritalea squalenifaciens DSM 18772]|uniref:Cytochrome c, mono-and diheme variants n=2 Tax=Rubritalea squalenifaciens TaxID=407226 RepID=A0A1M6HVZ7_9BACT|nr:Cytochrome c, mono-and diheme variants [Rubritalea squalenifaciens DSM 18772]
MRNFLLTSSIAIAASSLCFGQAGDRKGHVMEDPIPIDTIPPSPYLDLEAALKSFKLADGFTLEPVATGDYVNKSVALSFDADGRIWSCEMTEYMNDFDATAERAPKGKIRVLEDTDGDGKVDKATTFLDKLVVPRAVAVTSDGCLYTNGDALLFIKRDGIKPVGEPEVVDPKYAQGGNPEHAANALLLGIDNWYYNAKHDKRYRRINGKWIKEDTYGRGQWGLAKDNAGRIYHNHNSCYFQAEQFLPNFLHGVKGFEPKYPMSKNLGCYDTYPIHKTPGVNRGYMKGVLRLDKGPLHGTLAKPTASCGITIYRGDNFPEEYQEMGFSCEPAGDLIKAIKIKRNQHNIASGSQAFDKKEFLASNDEWFCPVSLYTAPDGTLYMVDMYFGLLQHKTYMTTYLRKQYEHRNMDRAKPSTGRIYRIRYAKNPAAKVEKLSELKGEELLSYLTHKNGHYRDTAQRLIVERQDRSVIAALSNDKVYDSKQPGYVAIHALWTLDGIDAATPAVIIKALKHKDHDVANSALEIAAKHRWTDEVLASEVAKLASTPQNIHGVVKTLVALGQSAEALKIIEMNPKLRGLNEAFVSGLGPDISTFDVSTVKSGSLVKLIAAAKKAAGPHQEKQRKLEKWAHESIKRGADIYVVKAACAGCHGLKGQGAPNMGPPLNNSEWVTGDANRLAKILLVGIQGPIMVNGQLYKAPNIMPIMPGFHQNTSISDQDYADVMNYIRNSWDNEAPSVKKDIIPAVRKEVAENNFLPLDAEEEQKKAKAQAKKK